MKSLAQNKRISALCLEQHEKGLFPDYAAIKARVLQKMNLCQLIELASKSMVLKQCICLHLVLHHIIHPLHNCKISATPVCHCRKNLKALGGNRIRSGLKLRKRLKPILPLAARNKKKQNWLK